MFAIYSGAFRNSVQLPEADAITRHRPRRVPTIRAVVNIWFPLVCESENPLRQRVNQAATNAKQRPVFHLGTDAMNAFLIFPSYLFLSTVTSAPCFIGAVS